MQFISDRHSLASSFAFQTQNSSSYLLSSRASRRKVIYDQHDDATHQQIQDFKQQIEQKFIESITNKIYTFPLTLNSKRRFNDSDLTHLQGDVQISLYDDDQKDYQKDYKRNQQPDQPQNHGPIFKIMNKKPQNPQLNAILSHLKTIKQNVIALTLYHQDPYFQANQFKPLTNNLSLRKSKSKNQKPQLKSGRTKITYETTQTQQDSPNLKRQHLHTEPYEKPMGYILKKK